MKPSPSVTQRNKQPWHPDEDDEEFTANEDEGQACSLCPVALYSLNRLDLPFHVFSCLPLGLCSMILLPLILLYSLS